MEGFINKREDSESEWIEEEEKLIHWAENPNFEKTPLDHIALTFVYTNKDKIVVGIAKTIMELETKNTFSILHRISFFDKVHIAKNPSTFGTIPERGHNESASVGIEDRCAEIRSAGETTSVSASRTQGTSYLFRSENNADGNAEWLKKAYTFDESMLCHIDIDANSNQIFNPKVLFTPLQFSNDIAKISSSRVELKDLYEIVVIMREATEVPPTELKSILKTGSKPGKTKKVRIDENVYFVAKSNKKRKTKKRHPSSPFTFS